MNPIEELYALQETRGYLAEKDLRALSERRRIPLYELEGIASFYPHFRRRPPPALRVGACRDLSCHLRDRGHAVRELESLCAGRGDVDLGGILGLVAVILATINVVGGFLVTNRMLLMFKKKK